MQLQIAPSVLAADFLHLGDDIQMLNENADVIHLDVMDGTFVPNMSFGFSVIEQVAPIARIPMDVHLMVVHPERWFEKLAKIGVQMVSFHYEAPGARRNTAKHIKKLHELGLKAGVVINPDIPVENLFPYIGKADYFLIMSVYAGFGGQKFIPDTLTRISALRDEIARRGATAIIEVDGGVTLSNIKELKEAGVTLAVAGSTVFKSDDPGSTIAALRGA